MSTKPDDLIEVSDEFASILGMTVEDCKLLSLRELSNRAFDAGYDLTVTTRKVLDGEAHLKMSVERFVMEHVA